MTETSSNGIFKGFPRWIALLITLFFIGAIVYYLAAVIVYVITAVIISLMAKPIYDRIEKIKIGKFQSPDALSALIALGTVYLIFIAFIAMFAPLIIDQINALSQIDINNVMVTLEEPLNKLSDRLAEYNIIEQGEKSPSETIREHAINFLSLGNFTSVFNNIIGILGNIAIAMVSITFISFFFIKDDKLFLRSLLLITPNHNDQKVKNIMHNAYKMLSRYFIGIGIEALLITLIAGLGLWILGVKYALLIAFFAGVTNIIPYLGPFLGSIFGISIFITSNYSEDFNEVLLPKCIWILIVMGITQVLDNYFFQPIIFSKTMKSHPLEIFLVVLIAGTLAGIAGMILAIPVYTMVRVVAKEFFFEFKIVKKLTEEI